MLSSAISVGRDTAPGYSACLSLPLLIVLQVRRILCLECHTWPEAVAPLPTPFMLFASQLPNLSVDSMHCSWTIAVTSTVERFRSIELLNEHRFELSGSAPRLQRPCLRSRVSIAEQELLTANLPRSETTRVSHSTLALL